MEVGWSQMYGGRWEPGINGGVGPRTKCYITSQVQGKYIKFDS